MDRSFALFACLDFIMRLWYTMGEQALIFYPVKFALTGVQGKEGTTMQSIFEENKNDAPKGTPLWVYAVGVGLTVVAVGTFAYYFWPF